MWKKIHKPRDWAKQGQAVSASDKLHAISGFGHGGHDPQPKPTIPEHLPKPSYPAAHARNSSSVYSEDTSAQKHNHGEVYSQPYSSAYQSGHGDVESSPPVSPIREHYSSAKGSHNVSPVEESASAAFPSRYGKDSGIPRLAGYSCDVTAGNQATRPLGGKKYPITKWDDYSGEPTASDKGKYAQASPGHAPLQGYSGNVSSKAVQPSPKGSESMLGHMNVFKTRRRMESDTSSYGRPPPLPSKDGGHRVRSNTQPIGNQITSTKLTKSRGDKELPEAPKPKPAVPQKDKAPGKPMLTPLTLPSPTYLGLFDDKPQPVSFAPAPDTGRRSLERSARHNDAESSVMSDDELRRKLQGVALPQEPCSRFSATTYATTEPGSPPPTSDVFEHPVPEISSTMQQYSAKSTTRKPTPSQISSAPESGTQPQPQPETSIATRIDEIKAKLADLGRRKTNIDTIIHELTQVIQPSSIAYDMATRSEVNKTVTSLNNELADIKKEEHELGLKLLRAYKKRDQGDIYANDSMLWVKRVTS